MATLNQIILYFFSPNPGRIFNYYIVIGIFIAILIAFGVTIVIYSRKNKKDKAFKKLFRNFPTKFFILAVLLMIYLSFRYYLVPFFSMRFLLYVMVAVAIYVIASAINTYIKKYPVEKERREHRLEQNKYIPKKKKRKK